jgi:hypothetical protein
MHLCWTELMITLHDTTVETRTLGCLLGGSTHLARLEIVNIASCPTSSADLATSQPIRIWVIYPSGPLSADAADTSLGSHSHLDILRLVHKLLLNRRCLVNKESTRPFQRVGGVGAVVTLDLELDVIGLRMGDFVACKEHGRVEQELTESQPSLQLPGV